GTAAAGATAGTTARVVVAVTAFAVVPVVASIAAGAAGTDTAAAVTAFAVVVPVCAVAIVIRWSGVLAIRGRCRHGLARAGRGDPGVAVVLGLAQEIRQLGGGYLAERALLGTAGQGDQRSPRQKTSGPLAHLLPPSQKTRARCFRFPLLDL